jgi:hypothetical protein
VLRSSYFNDEIWNTTTLLHKDMITLREDVVLLLIEDGRYFTDKSDIIIFIYNLEVYSLCKAYFYAVNLFLIRWIQI